MRWRACRPPTSPAPSGQAAGANGEDTTP